MSAWWEKCERGKRMQKSLRGTKPPVILFTLAAHPLHASPPTHMPDAG